MTEDVTPERRTARAYWACQLGGWGLYATVTVGQFTQLGMPLRRAVSEPLLAAALGIALTHGLRRTLPARAWLGATLRGLAARLGGTSLVVAAAFVLLLWLLEIFGYGDPASWTTLVFAWMRWTLVFFVWMALYFGYALDVARRQAVARLTAAVQAAELRSLKSQLNPHFLFNSLNAVRALIGDDPGRARDAVTQLARTLRYSLSVEQDDLVTLDRELEMVDDYLALESLRLGERLVVERDIAERAGGARIPVMLLQTLVENAVKHGIAQLPAGGILRVSVRLADGALLLDVENPRPRSVPSPSADEDGAGVGLSNALERLRLLFGPSAELALDLTEGRAVARVRIPAVPSLRGAAS